MKKYLLMVMVLFLSGCPFRTDNMMNTFYSTDLIVTNESTDWEMASNVFFSSDTLRFRNKTYPFIVVEIDIAATLYNGFLTKYDCKSKLDGSTRGYQINFRVIKDGHKPESDEVYFNPFRYYYERDNKKTKMYIWDYALKYSKIKWADDYFNITPLFDGYGVLCIVYESPLICGELEDVNMVFDGFIVNKKQLPPIKVHYRYGKPENIPLYIVPLKKEIRIW